MLARVFSVALKGIEGYPVMVEADLANGLPGFVTVGLPDAAVKESRERVIAAVRNSGFEFPHRRITVNLAPAQARKEGSSFDLPMALAVLSASGQIPPRARGGRYCFVGELALDGGLRPVPGVLSMAIEAKANGFEAIVVPAENAAEARFGGLAAYGIESLREAARLWCGELPISGLPVEIPGPEPQGRPLEDIADVKGQMLAKRALEIAAAGGHNLILIGCPGVGKSMLARRLTTILPSLSAGEALEVTRIHSASNKRCAKGLISSRPFHSPHHSASTAALVGGGKFPHPGEVTLAHGGVLFLDELAEFGRHALEALRQPLEDGVVAVARASAALSYPARFILVAATNPCPCGYSGHQSVACRCTPQAVRGYLSRLSGPLLDRIDLQVELAPLDFKEWSAPMTPKVFPDGRQDCAAPAAPGGSESSSQVRSRVESARRIQSARFNGRDFSVNATIGARDIRRYCPVDPRGLRLMEAASKKLGLSARALDRVLKVGRTIADLAGAENIASGHVAEALQFRCLDRWNAAGRKML